MPRYKLTIEYDGTPFVGWQLQDNGPSVQGVHRGGDRSVHRRARRPCTAPAAPMPACMRSARSPMSISRRRLGHRHRARRLNAHLRPHPVAVLAAEQVADDFRCALLGDASGTISTASSTAAPISRSSAAAPGACRRPLDAAAMHEAAQRARRPARLHHLPRRRVPGEIAGEDARPARRAARAATTSRVSASARSFLHHQVRSMVGSLVQVGEGRWSADDLGRALAARDRNACGAGRAAGRALSGTGGLSEDLPEHSA